MLNVPLSVDLFRCSIENVSLKLNLSSNLIEDSQLGEMNQFVIFFSKNINKSLQGKKSVLLK